MEIRETVTTCPPQENAIVLCLGSGNGSPEFLAIPTWSGISIMLIYVQGEDATLPHLFVNSNRAPGKRPSKVDNHQQTIRYESIHSVLPSYVTSGISHGTSVPQVSDL